MGGVVEGELKERGEARRDYKRAVRQGHRASIAEEERPGVFSLRVGNLMPGDLATVELTMAGVLPYRDGEVTFRFPLVVAPRYMPGVPLSGPSVGAGTAVDTNAVPDASRISPPVLLPGFPNPVRLSLVIDVYEPADDLRVSLFTVWGEDHGDVRRLIVQPGERLDRDFILRFRLGGDHVRTSLTLHPDAGVGASGEGTFALTIVPPALGTGHKPQPRDVVLLLDRSGSMEGWKMVAARRAMARMIDTLGDADRFAVLAFDDRIEAPPSGRQGRQLIAASDRNRFRAVEFLAKVESRGGTEIARPLDQAVGLLDAAGDDRDRILVLVTDGQVGNEDQVLQKVGPRLKPIRVFTLGIDQAVNEGFLRRLTELGQGGGTCELVESEDRLDAVMETIHRRIAAPVVTDVCLEASSSSPGVDVLAETLVPDRAPSLFAGSPLLLMGRYRGWPEGPVEVRGQMADGEPWGERVVAVVRDNPAIVAAWARGQIRQLEDRYAAGFCDRGALERSIIATSLRFGVLCRFTAYVAVDRAVVVNEGGELHQITQPVEMPAGWGRERVVAEACMTAPMAMSADESCELAPPSMSPPASRTRGRVSALAFDLSPLCSSPASVPRKAVPPPPPSTPPPPLTPEQSIEQAGYELLEKLGEDVHGTLYKGRDRRKRLVLVRLLKKPVVFANAAELAALEKVLKGLKHAAIVPVIKLVVASSSGAVIAVVSEYVVATTLTERFAQNESVEPEVASRFVLALAEALEYAERRAMIHGNLTPDHILIGQDGQPRIGGFGLLRLECEPDVSCATVRVNVAPEILRSAGGGPTAQTDVYSLGVMFYRLLTGILPDRGLGDEGSVSPRMINSAVPVELEAICLKALACESAARYGNASELAADLRAFLGSKKRGLIGRIRGKPKGSAAPPSTEKGEREGFWK